MSKANAGGTSGTGASSRFPKFSLGEVVQTPGVESKVSPSLVQRALARHIVGDWGELDEYDQATNEETVRGPYGPLMSQYRTEEGTRFWIITSADRSVTTVLLPEEY